MKIYLFRHGRAEEPKPGRPDAERTLTDEGRAELAQVLERAKAARTRPSLILASPYLRAIETARIAAEALGYESRIPCTNALTPEASPYDVWEEIRERRGESAILLAGHEPLMSSLAAFLLNSPALAIKIPPGTLVRLDCDSFGRQPKGLLRWMITAATAR